MKWPVILICAAVLVTGCDTPEHIPGEKLNVPKATVSVPSLPPQTPCRSPDVNKQGFVDTLDPQLAFYHYMHITLHGIGRLSTGQPYNAYAGAENGDANRGLLLISIEPANPCDPKEAINDNPTPTEYALPADTGPIVAISGLGDTLTVKTRDGAVSTFSVVAGKYTS